MKHATLDNTIARWTRVGILFGGRPGRPSPDLERLLLDTARWAPTNARLFNHAVSWLAHYDNYVARHRLKRLIIDTLEPTAKPVLGLLLDLAIKHGAARELNIAADQCGRAEEMRHLFDVHTSSKARRRLGERSSCPEAARRGLWAPDVDVKADALRPASWIIRQNPGFHDRVVRKGDLRVTILETLRRDAPRQELDSEQALVTLCAARPESPKLHGEILSNSHRWRQVYSSDKDQRKLVPQLLDTLRNSDSLKTKQHLSKLIGQMQGEWAVNAVGKASITLGDVNILLDTFPSNKPLKKIKSKLSE